MSRVIETTHLHSTMGTVTVPNHFLGVMITHILGGVKPSELACFFGCLKTSGGKQQKLR